MGRKIYVIRQENGKNVVKIKEWVPSEKTFFQNTQIILGFFIGISLFALSVFLDGGVKDSIAMISFFTLIFATLNTIRLTIRTKAIERDPWCDEMWMLEGINVNVDK